MQLYHNGPIEFYWVRNIDTGKDSTFYDFESAEEYYLEVSDGGSNDAWGIYAKL